MSDEPTHVKPGNPPPGGGGQARSNDGSSALPIGFELGDFRIERVLGEGGFGIVYLARDLRLERAVAIKEFMPLSLAGRQSDLRVTVLSARHQETFDLARRSFINEAKLLAHFDHPSLVKVLQFWEDRGTAYMAMPYYQGMTLKQWLRTPGNHANEAFLRGLLRPVVDALAHLHAENCFHRDIAPDNIMLLPDGRPLLIDFGAARMVIGDATQALTVILKPGFAPIEQYADSAVMKQGAWTDIYALAAVLYFVISGRAPPPSAARIVADEMAPAAGLGGGQYSAPFLAMIDACLAIRPADRPQTADEVRRLLDVPVASPHSDLHGAPDDDDQTVVLAPKRAAPVNPLRTVGPRPETQPGAIAEQKPQPKPKPKQTQAASADLPPTRPKLAIGAGLLAACALALWIWAPWSTPAADPHAGPSSSTVANAPPASAPALPELSASRPGSSLLASASAPAAQPTEPASASASASEPTRASSEPRESRPVSTTALQTPGDAFEAVDLAMAQAQPARRLVARFRATPAVVDGELPRLTVSSGNAGYLYVFLAEPRADHWQLIFPNKLDRGNEIAADATLSLPRKGWSIRATEPVGARRLLVLVADTPRDFDAEASAGGGPFASIALKGDTAANGGGAAASYLGKPRCEGSVVSCSAAFSAARIEFNVGARPVVRAPPSNPPDNSKASGSGNANAGGNANANGNAKKCADLLAQQYQQLSLGINSAEIASQRAKLHCK
ncbi:hypothetical protein BH11PSE8_BH11PSE8_00220 [soil metagenome]